jgi:hypothetical protein
MWRPCEACGTVFEPLRANHRFHSGTCRVAYRRGVRPPANLAAVPPAGPAPPAPTPETKPPLSETVVDTVRRDLERAGRLDTWLGQSALAMAKVLATGVGTPAGLSSANRELRETMAAALRGATTPGSAVVQHRDEVAERRAARGSA